MGSEEEIEELERKTQGVGEIIKNLERRLVKPKRDKENERYLGVSVILAIVFMISYQLVDSSNWIVEVVSISVFAIYLLASAYLKLDFKIPLLTAVFLLIFCAVTLPFSFDGLANQGGITAYYYLATGIIGLLADYFRESRQKSNPR